MYYNVIYKVRKKVTQLSRGGDKSEWERRIFDGRRTLEIWGIFWSDHVLPPVWTIWRMLRSVVVGAVHVMRGT